MNSTVREYLTFRFAVPSAFLCQKMKNIDFFHSSYFVDVARESAFYPAARSLMTARWPHRRGTSCQRTVELKTTPLLHRRSGSRGWRARGGKWASRNRCRGC
ncbi:hypothetical protein BDV95DRAFT_569358 [Massariosphaeria phaeospora]|uniref:Uncharacterized protein n=1 Tax=Massariosphaeria phaeospora TaxID=100035 RepID=A0A7C8MFS4_9PLEO|nr:hypothetical protein BDV95DRAFT_569358 [Massariosphaeria phaeospora]